MHKTSLTLTSAIILNWQGEIISIFCTSTIICRSKLDTEKSNFNNVYILDKKRSQSKVKSTFQVLYDSLCACMQSRTHLRCNRNSANSLSVLPSKPRECFLSLQRLKTDSLKRMDFKEPGNFGLPTRRCEKAAISSCTRRLQTTNFTNIHRIYTK